MSNYTSILTIVAIFLLSILVAQNVEFIFGAVTGFFVSSINTTISNVTIGAVAPVLANVILEDNVSVGDAIIDLWGGAQRWVFCNATVNDGNGGGNFNTTIPNATIFDTTSVSYGASCNASLPATWDNNRCYLVPNSTYTSNCTWGNVINSTANFLNCTIGAGSSSGMWYFANRSTTGLWNCTIRVTDLDSLTSYGSDTSNVSELLAVGVPSLLDFGALSLGATSGETNLTNITNYGNSMLAFQLNGTNMACSLIGSIPVGLEKYNCTAYNQNYDTQYSNLTSSPNGVNCTVTNGFNLTKAITPQGSPALSTKNMSWKISIPSSGVSGYCTGTIWFIGQRA